MMVVEGGNIFIEGWAMGSGGSLEKKKNKVGKFFRDKSFQQKREFFFGWEIQVLQEV